MKQKSFGQIAFEAQGHASGQAPNWPEKWAASARAVVRAHNARSGTRIKWVSAKVARTWPWDSLVIAMGKNGEPEAFKITAQSLDHWSKTCIKFALISTPKKDKR